MTYGKPLGIFILIAVCTGSVYGLTYKTPEERIRLAIIEQNKAIEEANNAMIEAYTEIGKKCEQEATSTGSSFEILEKLSLCSNRPRPKLQELKPVPTIGNSGSVEGSSGSKDNVEKSKTKMDEIKLQDCLSKYKVIDNTIANVCMDYAEWTRTDNIDFEIETTRLDSLHKKVCDKQKWSPLCKDRALFDRLYKITEERIPWKNFFPILVGITNAESSLGLAFARDKVWGVCYWRNNWGWTKYQIHDDNTRTYSRSLNGFNYWQEFSGRFIDQFGCNLYPFESVEEFWITKVNGIRYGYKGCIDSKTPVKCISYKYVGNPNVAEESWISNVVYFVD